MSPRRKVVCAVIERGDRFLAARRKPQQSNGGLWEFPGGKVRPGETPAAALHREIGEELDAKITIHRKLTASAWDYTWIAIELIPFVCTITSDREPQPLDHAEIRFVLPEEALSMAWAPADRVIVERYCAAAVSPVCRKGGPAGWGAPHDSKRA
ncbi:MAG: (deoxy)nucleoside triphosphate pyrophosphohydrolase [Chitinispirillaceae bacterium]|nr:(deoxy)nucleoside triphosphate pyrophosphohydrolase [Chitinispirillaceae bacterium]